MQMHTHSGRAPYPHIGFGTYIVIHSRNQNTGSFVNQRILAQRDDAARKVNLKWRRPITPDD